MHRMCKIIHTDFKPENVVICLKDEEADEINKTGQLTTTKMFNKGEDLKRINMRITGGIPTKQPNPKEEAAAAEGKESWDVEGLTTKQR